MKGAAFRKQWFWAGNAFLQDWNSDSLTHKKPYDKKPWAVILHVSTTGSYWETLRVSCQGSEGEKPRLVWSTLWGSLEDCRMRTSANTRVLVTLSCPIPSLLLFVLVKLVEFLTKAGVTELWELLCSLSLNFFQSPQCNEDLFLVFAGEHHQVFNSSSLRQRLPAQSNWNVATCLYCITGATQQRSSEDTWKKNCC